MDQNTRKKIRLFFDLLAMMTEKELKARYKNTIFGFVWVFVNPLLQMLVIGSVFQFFIKQQVEYYFYYLFSGLIIWNFFTLSLTKATPSVVYERVLIKKAKFPVAVIPLSIILSNFVHFLLSLLIFIVPVLFIGTFSFTNIPYLFLGIILLLMFTSGLGLFTTALNVKYRDVYFFVQALILVWFYATPIVFTLSFIPREYVWLWFFNPLTVIIQLFQYALLGGVFPSTAIMLWNGLIILAVSCIGYSIFNRQSNSFDDLV